MRDTNMAEAEKRKKRVDQFRKTLHLVNVITSEKKKRCWGGGVWERKGKTGAGKDIQRHWEKLSASSYKHCPSSSEEQTLEEGFCKTLGSGRFVLFV